MKGKITIKGLQVDMENSPIVDKLKDVNAKVDKLIKQMEKDNQPGIIKKGWSKFMSIFTGDKKDAKSI